MKTIKAKALSDTHYSRGGAVRLGAASGLWRPHVQKCEAIIGAMLTLMHNTKFRAFPYTIASLYRVQSSPWQRSISTNPQTKRSDGQTGP